MKWLLNAFVICFATSAMATTTHLRLEDEINDETVQPILDGIENAPHGKDDRVVIEINSPGGEVEPGFKLVKAIEHYHAKVVCIVDGTAASMASYLFVGCDVRAMTKRSVLMIHQPGMGDQGQLNELLNAADWMKAYGVAMAEGYALHMKGITAADIIARTFGGREMWLDWREAKKLGAVDVILDKVEDYK